MAINSSTGGDAGPDPAVLAKYPRFAQLALTDGLVAADDLDRATAIQAQSGARLGDVLLQCGYLSAGQVGYLRVRLGTELGSKPVVPRKVQILGRQMLAQGLASPLMVGMAIRAWAIHKAEGRDVSLAAVSAELKHITAFQQVKLETQGMALLHCARCDRAYQVEGYAPGYRICCLACRQPVSPAPEGHAPSAAEELFFDRDRADQLNRFGTLALLRGFATREQLMEAARVQAQQGSEEHIGQVLVGLGLLTPEGKASLDEELRRSETEEELKRRAKLLRMAFGEIALKRGLVNIPLLRRSLNSQLAARKRGANVMLGALMEDDRVLSRYQVLSILGDQGKRLARCATCGALYNVPIENAMPACPADAGRLEPVPEPEGIEVAVDLCPDPRAKATGKIQRPVGGTTGEVALPPTPAAPPPRPVTPVVAAPAPARAAAPALPTPAPVIATPAAPAKSLASALGVAGAVNRPLPALPGRSTPTAAAHLVAAPAPPLPVPDVPPATPRHSPAESECATPTVILTQGSIAEAIPGTGEMTGPGVALQRLAEAGQSPGRGAGASPSPSDRVSPSHGVGSPSPLRPGSRPAQAVPVAPMRPTLTPSRGVPTSFVDEIDATMSPVPPRPGDSPIPLPSALMPSDESWAPFDTEQALDDGLLEFDEAVTIKFACIQCDKRLRQSVQAMDGRGRCPRCRAPVLRVEPLDAHLLEIVCRCGTTVSGDDARCPRCRARIYRRRQREGVQPLMSIPALDAMSVDQLVGLDDSEAAFHIGDESSLLRVIDLGLDLGGGAAGSAKAELEALYDALGSPESDVASNAVPVGRAVSDPARLPLIHLAGQASSTVRFGAPAASRRASSPAASRAWVPLVGAAGAAIALAVWGIPLLVARKPAVTQPREEPSDTRAQNTVIAFDALIPSDLISVQGTVPWGERYVVREQGQQAFAVRTPDGRTWWVVDAAGAWSFHALASRVDPAEKDVEFHVEVVGRVIRSTTFVPPAGLDVAATLFLSERWSRLREAPATAYLRRLEAATPGR